VLTFNASLIDRAPSAPILVSFDRQNLSFFALKNEHLNTFQTQFSQ